MASSHDSQTAPHFDVLIVGAGISGLGSAFYLRRDCPEKSFVILESQESFGGTWLTHKYPGIRSDSDLYTFGYSFKPWTGVPIATAEEIRKYLGEVIDENDLEPHIRYNHHITRCSWDSAANVWTVEASDKASGEQVVFTCNFLWMCQGYYDHKNPYMPEWPGMDSYKGLLIHPQFWDPEIDYKDKRVLVIGSGATAATIIPEFAKQAHHVTMLQRSPTYFMCGENKNELADRLRQIGIDEPTVHRVVRAQLMYDRDAVIDRAKVDPDGVFEDLKNLIRKFSGDENFQFEPHFTPKYRPWQQRLAFCPEGDLFKAATSGKLTVVTDEIETFTEKGVRTRSGEEIEADLIVAATGFNLLMMGGIPFFVDGRRIEWNETVSYRGMMFPGVPNMLWVMGYFRIAWTLRVEMLGEFVCRLLKHMDAIGARRVEVALRDEDKDMELRDWMEQDEFNPGYMKRGMSLLPRAGSKPIWRHSQDFHAEYSTVPNTDLNGEEFLYDGVRANNREKEPT